MLLLLRCTVLQVGVVSAAVGSSYVERQGTKLLCAMYGDTHRRDTRCALVLNSARSRGVGSVFSFSLSVALPVLSSVCSGCAVLLSYGPRASSKLSSTPFSERRGAFLCDVRFAPFSSSGARRARRGNQATEDEKSLSLLLEQSLTVSIHLESFPKAVLEAYVTVLQEDGKGSIFPAAVCALSLALAQAGVMMYDLVVACSALTCEGKAVLDPSEEEEEEWKEASEAGAAAAGDDSASAAGCASVSLAYLPSLRQISSVTQSGSASVSEVTKLTHMCIAGCEQLAGLMKECLTEAAKKNAGGSNGTQATTAATAATAAR